MMYNYYLMLPTSIVITTNYLANNFKVRVDASGDDWYHYLTGYIYEIHVMRYNK